jgi:hypoxanthine phosphoribosyltransferase
VARAGQTGATTTTHADADAGAGVGSPSGDTGRSIIVEGVEFHHASEAEFARLLTYYGIEWQYEPHQFALQWREGRPTEMFTPDFYLPEYDLYIELTTMRQSLVRRKNRKLRLLRALYPDINIKLLYRRDYQRLLNRFGIRHGEPDAIEE